MPTLNTFILSLAMEHEKLLHMGMLKSSKSYALIANQSTKY